MNLREQGFRFVWRDGRFDWVQTLQEGDTDCTDMSDEEFDAFAIPLLKTEQDPT